MAYNDINGETSKSFFQKAAFGAMSALCAASLLFRDDSIIRALDARECGLTTGKAMNRASRALCAFWRLRVVARIHAGVEVGRSRETEGRTGAVAWAIDYRIAQGFGYARGAPVEFIEIHNRQRDIPHFHGEWEVVEMVDSS
jgi:hypothetical protein